MFHESDKYAEILYHYFSRLGKNHINSLETEDKEYIIGLFNFWKKSFHHQTLDQFKKGFILCWNIIAEKVPNLQPLVGFFIGIMNYSLPDALPKDLQPQDIKAGLVLAIIFKNNHDFVNLVPLTEIDADIVKIIYSEGNLQMYQTICKYYTEKSLLNCLEDHVHYHDLEDISDLGLLKLVIEQGANKKRLGYLSLITAIKTNNYPLLVYLLRDIKVHQQSTNNWTYSAFDRALDKKDEISLHLLVKSGAFKISNEIKNKIELITKKTQNKLDDKHAGDNSDIDNSETSNSDDGEFIDFYLTSPKTEINTLLQIFANDKVELCHIKETILTLMQDEKYSIISEYLKTLLAKISPPSLEDLCIKELSLYDHSIETKELIKSKGLTEKLNNAILIQSLNFPEEYKSNPLPQKHSYESARLFYQPHTEDKKNESTQSNNLTPICCTIS